MNATYKRVENDYSAVYTPPSDTIYTTQDYATANPAYPQGAPSNLSDTLTQDIQTRVRASFSDSRFAEAKANGEILIIVAYIDSSGVLSELEYVIPKSRIATSILNESDFQAIDQQLRGLQLEVPPVFKDFTYFKYNFPFRFAKME